MTATPCKGMAFLDHVLSDIFDDDADLFAPVFESDPFGEIPGPSFGSNPKQRPHYRDHVGGGKPESAVPAIIRESVDGNPKPKGYNLGELIIYTPKLTRQVSDLTDMFESESACTLDESPRGKIDVHFPTRDCASPNRLEAGENKPPTSTPTRQDHDSKLLTNIAAKSKLLMLSKKEAIFSHSCDDKETGGVHPRKVKGFESITWRRDSITKPSSDESYEVPNLLALLESAKWKKLGKAIKEIEKKASPGDIRKALQASNADHETVLHIAAWKAPEDQFLKLIQLIMRTHDDSKKYMMLVNNDGNMPLHLACANAKPDDLKSNFSAIRNALLMAPKVLEAPNRNGDTPLHLLMASKAFNSENTPPKKSVAKLLAQAIESLMSMAPKAVMHQNKQGLTLLHIAIANKAHDRVIQCLLEKSPQVTALVDQRGMLPLHYIAAFLYTRISSRHMKLFIAAHPPSVTAPTHDGDTPLHLLMSNARARMNKAEALDYNMAKLTVLLSEAIDCTNNEGLTPLHATALFDTPAQFARILLESPRGQRASVMPTPNGDTPLHLLCARDHVSKDLMIALATPEACEATDSQGRIPVVVAMKNRKMSATVSKILLEAYHEQKLNRQRQSRRSSEKSQKKECENEV